MNRLFARGASVPVLQMGHAGLRQKSVPVSLSDLSSNGVLMNVQRMWKAMDEEQRVSGSTAVGLAAPQVGWHRRVVTLRGPPREKTAAKRHNDAPLADLVMVNPVLHVLRPQETVEMEESCLSVRGLVGLVTRSKYVAVEYVDLSGKKHTLECEGWYAGLVQHEMDHLDGVLFVDRVKPRLLAFVEEWTSPQNAAKEEEGKWKIV